MYVNCKSGDPDVDVSLEPKPAPKHIRGAPHYWLDAYDSDGHYKGRVVLQWAPSEGRWTNSGLIGSGIYVNTMYWKCHSECLMPE